MPSPRFSDFDYAALLYSGERSDNPSSENFVQGTKATDEDKLTFSFQRPNAESGLSLEIFAFKKDTDAADFSRGNALLSGKTKDSLTVSAGSDKIEVNEIIELEMNEESEESGTVHLEIKLPDGYTLDIDDKTNFTCNKKDEISNIYVIEEKPQDGEDGIPAKAYPVRLIVMDGEKIVRVFPEHINVLHGMRTDTWGGLAKGVAKEIKITISTTFFVRGTGDGWYTEKGYANITGDNDNPGSFLAPFATIQEAVNAVIAQNDGSSKYTIYVDGIVKQDETLTQDETPSGDGMVDFSALNENLNLTIMALSENTKATLDANKVSRVIYANPTSVTLELTIKNLIVKNGLTRETECGGGIYFGSTTGGTLTVDGCTIIGNTASQDGGGVYITGGTFTMEDGTIGTVDDKNTAYKGGGVYVDTNCNFTMKAGTIDGNIAKQDGGGIYGGGNFTMIKGTISNNTAPHGCGLYIKNGGKFIMNDGEIIGNKVESSNSTGGGVWNKGSFEMNGGTISNNTAKKGGGVYLVNPTGIFKIKGKVEIAKQNDVYLDNERKIDIAGKLTNSSFLATITPNDYKAGREVLNAGTGVTIDENICKKFTVTPQDDNTEWEIVPNSNGAGVLSKVVEGGGIEEYELGDDGPGGGVVFYKSEEGFVVNGKTCHYLECSKEPLKVKVVENGEEKEIAKVAWCPYLKDGSGNPCTCEVNTYDGIGAGWANTQEIIQHQNHKDLSAAECAAKACAEYSPNTPTAGGWYLPSASEILEMTNVLDSLQSLDDNLVLKPVDWEECWTSTSVPDNNTQASTVILQPSTSPSKSSSAKHVVWTVRPVHAF